MEPQVQQLLDAKDTIIEQQQTQIVLLQELAEQRRLVHLHQSKELAELRDLHEYSRNKRWVFFFWLLLENVWPFSIWYHRFER
jgi:hypothetical protein